MLVGDGPEACVIKLLPAAFSRHAEQEQRALRALETIRPALLAVPRGELESRQTARRRPCGSGCGGVRGVAGAEDAEFITHAVDKMAL